MAPTAPKTRPSIRGRKPSSSSSSKSAPSASKPTNPLSHTRSSSRPIFPSSSATFTNSKSDKRIIKHSSFVSRIEKSSKKPLKRRRPSKKLVTTLESLGDALPDVQELLEKKEKGVVKEKSLSHGKGFLKRRDKVEKGERERFGRNLGVIMASSRTPAGAVVGGEVGAEGGKAEVTTVPASATAGRFAAIRAWVNKNVEKHEGFQKRG